MKLTDVGTPALCVDVDVLDRNLRVMASFFEARPASLRPHVKAHKTPAIAKLQAAAGCEGFTCATVWEAEVMAARGFGDLLIANEILDPTKRERLRRLSDSALVTVAIDSREALDLVRDLPIAALVDVNVGLPRCGVDRAGALELALAISETEVNFRGVMGYEGHAMAIADRELRDKTAREAVEVLVSVAAELSAEGLDVSVVSAGGTGTYDTTGTAPGVTEVQAGSYALMDTTYSGYGLPFEEALGVLCTVLSVQGPIAVLDGGLKALAVDHGSPQLHEGTPANVLFLSDEHTTLATGEGFSSRPGDRMWLRPSHVDPTVNLHDVIYAFRDTDVVDVWPVEARGYGVAKRAERP
ncbi:MAG TPA: alanine racemase [Actinomycetota bacterium]|nr:alanine racemase [Actinomycetota bacterium]